jgi:hypothetical protein
LTVSVDPSTPSTVPRTRTGGGCWAKLAEVASNNAKPATPKTRREIWLMSSSQKFRPGRMPGESTTLSGCAYSCRLGYFSMRPVPAAARKRRRADIRKSEVDQ